MTVQVSKREDTTILKAVSLPSRSQTPPRPPCCREAQATERGHREALQSQSQLSSAFKSTQPGCQIRE